MGCPRLVGRAVSHCQLARLSLLAQTDVTLKRAAAFHSELRAFLFRPGVVHALWGDFIVRPRAVAAGQSDTVSGFAVLADASEVIPAVLFRVLVIVCDIGRCSAHGGMRVLGIEGPFRSRWFANGGSKCPYSLECQRLPELLSGLCGADSQVKPDNPSVAPYRISEGGSVGKSGRSSSWHSSCVIVN